MLRNIASMSLWQRRLVFLLIFGGGILGLVAITLLLVSSALNGSARVVSVALVPEVTVRQFAALPDDDAYPATVAVCARRHSLHRQLCHRRGLEHHAGRDGERSRPARAMLSARSEG